MISDKIEAIKAAVNEQLAKSEHLQDVQDIRVKFLGKKGELTAIMKEMKNFSKEERPKVGHRRTAQGQDGRSQGPGIGYEDRIGKNRHYPAGPQTGHGP